MFSSIKLELHELQTRLFDNFWNISDDSGGGTVVLGLKVIWRSFKVISRSFWTFSTVFSALIYTNVGLPI